MKVGTDGVLLGAWVPVRDAGQILDVGCGTGLVSLMLAQRSKGKIDAVEIDLAASEESKLNFERSIWNGRLDVFNTDFLEFSKMKTALYDLIVSNPPFFVNSLKSNSKSSAIARHDHMLSFGQLIIGARNLLRDEGRLCVIIPFESLLDFKELARLCGFYLLSLMSVIPRAGMAPKRVLLEFTLQPTYPVESNLTILDENGVYTEKYKSLTAPYYPAF